MSSKNARAAVAGIVVPLLLVVAPLPAVAANKVVFMTSVSGKGDLSAWPDAGGQTGLAAADAICQARAAAGGLDNPGDFVAWMSDSNDDAYCRVHGFSGKKDANCGQVSLPTDAGPWVRTDGFPIGDTIEHLLYSVNAVLVPIYLDEFGIGNLSLQRQYFTHTSQWGKLYPDYTACADWTSSGPLQVRGGHSGMTAEGWTVGAEIYCDQYHELLCMEKGPGDPMPAFQSYGATVFIDSVFGNANLGLWAEAGGEVGAAAGDAICRKLAYDAGLPASFDYRAWLSTTTIDPNDPNDAIDRFYYGGPWVRVDGVPVANSKADLIDGELFAPINVTEKGVYLSTYTTWTGTVFDGTAAVDTCDDWRDGTNGYSGRTGMAYFAIAEWTDRMDRGCGHSVGRIYCFCQEVVLFADGFESGDSSSW